ncbi:MAG: lysylphosphatidylglycerol synthase transmembrane domain-containing protein [candidate division Zixibacteria bacterium]|nr:lysylphosphatidylglycerol synthase transmembrane domain-containing protein [candidate division Zixibacteria bacterium]
MTLQKKKFLYVIIGIGISVLLLFLLFRNIDFSDLGNALKGANYLWLIPNIALIVLTMYQRAYRWKAMVEPIDHVTFPRLLGATCIGFMANNVLPLRLGEFVRAYSLASREKYITKSASLATIFVERMVFDLVVLLLIFGAILYFSDLSLDPNMIQGLNIAVGIALIGIMFILILALKPTQTGNLMTRYLFFLPDKAKVSLESIILKFSHGLDFLSNIRSVTSVAVQTILIWLLMGVSNIFVFKAFGLDLPIDAAFVVLVVVSISILIPSSPGFVGVYHAGAVWAMMRYGVPKADALSCALVLHAAQYIVVTLMGFYFLKKEHLSLKRLEEEATDSEEGV